MKTLEPSGVKVILQHRPQAGTVGIAAGFCVGSAFDGAATCGCAHLIEHVLLFRGTELSHPHELVREWRSLGSEVNGCTYRDYVLFKASVEGPGLFRALELFREQLMHPVFSGSGLRTEADVICAEIATRSMEPRLRLYRLANQALYGEHSYGLPAIGFPRTLKEISPSTVYSTLDEEYTPGRLTLAIVGAFEPEEVLSFLENTFGVYAPGKSEPPVVAELGSQEEGGRKVAVTSSASAQLGFTFIGPPSKSADWLPFVVTANILHYGLQRRLIHQTNIAETVQLVVEPRLLGGFALFRVVLKPQAIPRCERELRYILSRVLGRPFGRQAVDRAVNKVAFQFAQRTERPEALASELVRQYMLGRLQEDLNLREALGKITEDRLKWIGDQYFTPSRYVVAALVPEGMEHLAESNAEKPVHKERKVLSNREPFPIVAQSRPSTKVYSFALAVKGGIKADPPGKEGLGGLVARAVLNGPEGQSREAFRDELLRWGVDIEAGTERDYTYIRFSAYQGYFKDALEGVSRAILSPAFRPADLQDTWRELAAETLIPSSVEESGERLLWEEAFSGTPYAVTPPGSQASVSALSKGLHSNVQDYWEKHWRADNFALAVSGPQSVNELVEAVSRAFSPAPSLSGGGSAEEENILFSQSWPHTIYRDLDSGGEEGKQGYVLFAWFCHRSTVENLVVFLLFREILAGGPGSRLWPFRQKEGLLYYLNGKVAVTAHVLGFQIGVVLPVENAGTVKARLIKEAQRPVEEAELKFAVETIQHKVKKRRERGLALVKEEAWFLLSGWSRAEFARRLEEITVEGFNRKIKQFFHASTMWTTAVGPEPALRAEFSGVQ